MSLCTVDLLTPNFCAALRTVVELAPGESKTVVFTIGAAENGRETVEELTESFYADDMGWDFDEIWTIDPTISPYPVFKWQTSTSGVTNVEKAAYNVYVTTDGIRAEGLNGNEMIYVYTTNGVLVAKQIAENTIENISLTGKGIYVVNIVSTGASQAFKVVK